MSARLLPGSAGPDGAPLALGVTGGGQLGRMFVHAAQAMGFRVVVLDPDAGGPAALAADDCVVAADDDPAGLDLLARRVAAVSKTGTTSFCCGQRPFQA